jgi:hypothetical protein
MGDAMNWMQNKVSCLDRGSGEQEKWRHRDSGR